MTAAAYKRAAFFFAPMEIPLPAPPACEIVIVKKESVIILDNLRGGGYL